MTNKWVVPVLVSVLAVGGIKYLWSQPRPVLVNNQMVQVEQPKVVAPQIPAPDGTIPVPGGVIRSLDKINAAAAAVGCDTLKPDDPAGRLVDVAECLGEKALAVARGQK